MLSTKSIFLTAAAALLAAGSANAVVFTTTFDSAAASSDFAAAVQQPASTDNTVTFGGDYSTLTLPAEAPAGLAGTTVPEAPNTAAFGGSARKGLIFQVNDGTTGLAQSISVLTNTTYSGDYEAQVDLYYLNVGTSGSTEDATFGINHSGTFPVAFRTGTVVTQTDGYFYKTFGDIDIAGNDHYLMEGTGAAVAPNITSQPGTTWADGTSADVPGRQGIDTLFSGYTGYAANTTTTGGAIRWGWNTVKLGFLSGVVTLSVNGTAIATYNDPNDTYNSGKVSLGAEDSFAGINTGNRVIFDNLRISSVSSNESWSLYQ